MGMTRRSILLILFKLFDSTLLVGSFLVASVPSLSGISAISLTDFLAMRISVRNFVLFTALVVLWHALFPFSTCTNPSGSGASTPRPWMSWKRPRLQPSHSLWWAAFLSRVSPIQNSLAYSGPSARYGPVEPACAAFHAQANPEAGAQYHPNADRGNQSASGNVCQGIGISIRTRLPDPGLCRQEVARTG